MSLDKSVEEVDEGFTGALEKVASANREGLDKLAKEEIAAQRQEETVLHRLWRLFKRKLGLRRSEAERISLS
ncbi:hypothetical protein [Candidatus Nanohalococcus occultus]|uniref:hypothetical protein n=1 Tax=Candidatus Nanohalococcus occultus TaxID=2978047 RepID=UPI0039E19A65